MSPAPFVETLARHGFPHLRRTSLTTLQVNIGRRCDLACHHCHVEAGPQRPERLAAKTADRILELLERSPSVTTLDLTGGAPELHDQFRRLVTGARELHRNVIDRCNLTVLLVPGQEDTAEFLALNRVEIIASLPCTEPENVDEQRGRGVFDRSIQALRWLNRLGYGQPVSPLRLDLVYNPLGAVLPPPQAELEERYRAELRQRFGIEFHHLLTITNMPIKRFAHQLTREGKAEEYLSLLVNHFNPGTVPHLMCRNLVSVGFDGQLYDCDFNQMLEIPLGGRPRTVWDIEDLEELVGNGIATDRHCYGCSAGNGSSCGGALGAP
ncbi:MAG: arsenosugar biosynthesis radical SAM (seleno)protein ArsS [Myxococcota bacterium]